MVLKQGRGASFTSFRRFTSMAAIALLLASCTPVDQGQNKPGAEAGDASVEADAESGDTFGFSALIKALKNLIGNPTGSTQRRDDNSGRVCTVDNFQQPDAQNFAKADILFVQDTSGSMKDEWQRVALNIQHLMQQLPAGVDVRLGVILAHVGQKSGQLFAGKNQPKVLSNQNMTNAQIGASLVATFAAGSQQTDPALGEAAFHSLNDAITKRLKDNQKAGFFRPDAALAIVFMSDEHEIGFPFPQFQAPGLPPRCDEYWEDRFKRDYYDSQGLTLDVLISRLKKLKGEAPITTHAFVNITREDLFRNNDPNASCLYDTLGYGYFEMIQKTEGVLFSIQDDRTEGMIRIGRSVSDGLELIHDFRLSKPADKVDPATIKAAVDGVRKPHAYDAPANLVHLDDAGTFGSKIRIEHCDYYQFDWVIKDFGGVPTHNSVTVSWTTPGMDTKAVLKVGLSADNLTFRSYTIDEMKTSHIQLVDGLQPETTYYFQVTARDKYTGVRVSDVIAVKTLAEPILWRIEDFGGTTTHNSATLSWKTPGEETRATLFVGLSADDLSLREIALPEFKVAQEQLVNELQPNTAYFFKVIAEDKKGRKVESEIISLRTKEEPPRDWMVVGFDATTTIDTATVFWQTEDFPTKAKLKIGLSANDLSFKVVDVTEFKAIHQETVTGLEPDTLYFFQVEATDRLNRVRVSQVISKRTKPDPITWSINDLAGVPTADSVSVSWNTGGEATKAVLKVGLSAENLTLREIKLDQLLPSHTQLVNNLEEDTTYFFQVVATDRKNRSLTSNVIGVKTLLGPARWKINNLGGNPDWNKITMSWNTGAEPTSAVLKVGLTADDLTFKTFNLAAPRTSQAQVVDGLEEMTTYFFQVVATDAKNRSVTSDVVSVRTTLGPIRWQINNLAGVPDWNQVMVSWNTGTEPTTAVLKVGLSATNLNFKSFNLANADVAHSQLVDGLEEMTTYFFQVVAKDKHNRTVTSDVISVKTALGPIRWQINNLAGAPDWNKITMSWNTGAEPTSAVLKVGRTADDLTFKSFNLASRTSQTQVVDGLEEMTSYFFQVVAKDKFDRTVTSEVLEVKTTLGPIRWNINNLAGNPDWNKITMSWNTGTEATKAVLKVGRSANDLSFRSYDLAAQTMQIQVVEDLEEVTTYFFQVVATDRHNRSVTSPILPVTTALGMIRWTINDFNGAPDWNKVTMAWNTGLESTSAVLKVGLSADNLTFKSFNLGANTSQTQVVEGLEELTTYFFQVVAKDKHNRTLSSEVISVRTTLGPVRWMINNLGGTAEWNKANISWNTGNESTSAVLKVGLSASDLTFKSFDLSARTSQTQLVEGLSELTTYFFQVIATDRHNRSVTSEVFSLTTPAEPILWNIQNVIAGPEFTTVNIAWNTGSEATRAVIELGTSAGSLDRSVSVNALNASHAVDIVGLQQNTQYFYRITAFDARNRQRQTSVLSFRTAEQSWTVAGLDATTTPTTMTVIWQTQNTMTNGKVRIGLSASDLTLIEASVTEFRNSHLINITGLQPSTRYFIQVEARDQEGRRVFSNVISKTTKPAAAGVVGGRLGWVDNSHLIPGGRR